MFRLALLVLLIACSDVFAQCPNGRYPAQSSGIVRSRTVQRVRLQQAPPVVAPVAVTVSGCASQGCASQSTSRRFHILPWRR